MQHPLTYRFGRGPGHLDRIAIAACARKDRGDDRFHDFLCMRTCLVERAVRLGLLFLLVLFRREEARDIRDLDLVDRIERLVVGLDRRGSIEQLRISTSGSVTVTVFVLSSTATSAASISEMPAFTVPS